MTNYEYTDFRMDNGGITFDDGTPDGGVLISIPFADDTPKAIKDILNTMIRWNIDVYLRDKVADGCILEPGHLMLNARLQIIYNSSELAPSYYITMVITNFAMVKNQQEVWIDDTYNIPVEMPELLMEFKKYCQQKLDEVLFPGRN